MLKFIYDKSLNVAHKSQNINFTYLSSYFLINQVPDLYIRQLREMKVLTLFEEISSLRLYQNSTITLSIG